MFISRSENDSHGSSTVKVFFKFNVMYHNLWHKIHRLNNCVLNPNFFHEMKFLNSETFDLNL